MSANRTKRVQVTGARGPLAISRLPTSQKPRVIVKPPVSKHAKGRKGKST